MSLHTWTPAALSSELRELRGTFWRIVEGQHIVSTLKLVDSLAEQDLLESLIEATKPPVPPECRHLDYLLCTPFRYDRPYPAGSRFRRAGRTPGVYYAAETPETAVAELAYYRVLFFAESPDTPWPRNAAEYTAFAAEVATAAALDLTMPPLSADGRAWTDPTGYEACQALAESCREAAGQAIRYLSVRDPARGCNLAVLTCKAFARPAPTERQTWRLRFGPNGVQAVCEFPRRAIAFDRMAFAADPRISSLIWERR